MLQLKTRESPHLFSDDIRVPDFSYPKQDQLAFENHIVGFHQNSNAALILILSNNQKANLSAKNATSEVRIPADSRIKKVAMISTNYDRLLFRVEFFDSNGKLILKAGYDGGNYRKEFELEDDERLIGMKSKL